MRASATRRPPATLCLCSTEALLPAPLTSAAARTVDYRCTSDRFLWTGRVATYSSPQSACSSIAVAESAGCAKREVQRLNADESSERLWYECGTSGLLRSSEELRGLELVA